MAMPILTQDGLSTQTLGQALRQSRRRQQLRAFLLVAPLLAFVILFFALPIAAMLLRSVDNSEFPTEMPLTSQALADWSQTTPVPEAAWQALALDLQGLAERKTVGKVAAAMNTEFSGARSLVSGSARHADQLQPPYRQAIVALDARWGDPATWSVMKRLSSQFSNRYFLEATDLTADATGAIVQRDEDQRIYIGLFIRTFAIAGIVAALCLALGYPVAYLLASLPPRYSNILLIAVLLPFWTSLLVRTTAWIALLQTHGVINSLLVWLRLVSDADRPQLIFNQFGTLVAMTHILLPFMILPLYSVMKMVPGSYMRAARSLGANQFIAFVRIYVPQTRSGIAAGGLLVFILALGYYITPALVGGESGTLISNMIAYHIQKSLNWNLAAALSSILLASVLLLYWLYSRLVGNDGLRLG